ncbi:Glycosyl transferase group 1 [Flavobacterium daejeonense]|nr:Glycosyl transferase group 1 [Flavobacterium daejeonense]
MKIFFPFKKEASFYFDEILEYTVNEFVFGCYTEYSSEFGVVNIHWPESIFNWKEPTEEQLKDFELALNEWKKKSKIIYTVHNLYPHSGNTKIYERLYEIIACNADLFIHLGYFSENLFKDKYPLVEHKVLRHPLFDKTYRKFKKDYAREKLGIEKDAIVFITPGRIRNLNEKKFILKAFKSVHINNKVLLATNMLREHKKIEFPGKYRLKKWIGINKILEKYFQRRYVKPNYIFNYEFMDNDSLSLYMSAADILLIPRIEILNSGLLFLGLTYKKIIIGPCRGNVTEHLKILQLPIFEPNDFKSVKLSLNNALQIFKEGGCVFEDSVLNDFKPKNVAFEYDNLITQVVENNNLKNE